MTLINIFAVSAIIVVSMVLFRALEIKLGRDIISKNFRQALDELIFDIWKICSDWLSEKRQKVLQALKKGFVYVLHVLIAVWGYALRKTLKAVSLVQGRADGSVRGYVAEHLQAVDSYKGQLKSEVE
jgi:uncharacterized membrane protein